MKQKKIGVREAVGLTTIGEFLNGELIMKRGVTPLYSSTLRTNTPITLALAPQDYPGNLEFPG